jgi:hypothetical protein
MIDDKDTASFLKFSVVYGEEDRLSKWGGHVPFKTATENP